MKVSSNSFDAKLGNNTKSVVNSSNNKVSDKKEAKTLEKPKITDSKHSFSNPLLNNVKLSKNKVSAVELAKLVTDTIKKDTKFFVELSVGAGDNTNLKPDPKDLVEQIKKVIGAAKINGQSIYDYDFGGKRIQRPDLNLIKMDGKDIDAYALIKSLEKGEKYNKQLSKSAMNELEDSLELYSKSMLDKNSGIDFANEDFNNINKNLLGGYKDAFDGNKLSKDRVTALLEA